MKAATKAKGGHYDIKSISIHAAREGGDLLLRAARHHQFISIHAAREGGDRGLPANRALRDSISIHAAREGGDQARSRIVCLPKAFQSTPPVKAATPQYRHGAGVTAISIHAAREGGDLRVALDAVGQAISIHAAREGGDALSFVLIGNEYVISIHAAREGGDPAHTPHADAHVHFNPRRP